MEHRSIIAIGGADRINFLQGILTQDVTKLNVEKIQFAALLSPQGKILHDMFLVDDGEFILIDTAESLKDVLLRRLAMYKLRAKVTIADIGEAYHVSFDASGLTDPRHSELAHRTYTASKANSENPDMRLHRLQLGIPELGHDFAPDTVVALDAGYDLLNAISFTKGCYVGQEITARMHYKNIARRGFYILENDTLGTRLSLLKFEDVERANSMVTVDNQTFHARLPAWMAPKLAQFKTTGEKQ